VNSGAAIEVANHWYEAMEESSEAAGDYQHIRHAIGEMLSDSATTGIAFRHDVPTVVALDGDVLIVLSVEPDADHTQAATIVETVPLDRSTQLTLRSGAKSIGSGVFRVRDWTFRRSGEILELQTREPLSRTLRQDLGGNRALSMVAERLGWPIPLDESAL
jgi:hypothetical protein